MARELKYSTHFTDLDALQRELGGSEDGPDSVAEQPGALDDEYEDWTGTER